MSAIINIQVQIAQVQQRFLLPPANDFHILLIALLLLGKGSGLGADCGSFPTAISCTSRKLFLSGLPEAWRPQPAMEQRVHVGYQRERSPFQRPDRDAGV